MPSADIRIKHQKSRLQKAVTHPLFGSKTILVDDNWDFVELWLRRNKKKEALFYWNQARAFNDANRYLTKLSNPLTSYYSALNAAKALLTAKGIDYKSQHGMSGETLPGRTNLANESVSIKGVGVLPSLCTHLGESVNGETHSLKEIFYNLAFIHRAYCVTFRNAKELFVPITDGRFVYLENSSEAWFSTEIADKKFKASRIIESLDGYEHDIGISERFVVRRKKRFTWVHKGDNQTNLASLRKEHEKIRKSAYYIHGVTRLWYLKRSKGMSQIVERSHLTLILMALHRISELARYNPRSLELHFSSQHNWLLSQFLERALTQFVDECSAEITGHEFMTPGYSPRS